MFHAAAVVSFQFVHLPTPESHSLPDTTKMTDKKNPCEAQSKLPEIKMVAGEKDLLWHHSWIPMT